MSLECVPSHLLFGILWNCIHFTTKNILSSSSYYYYHHHHRHLHHPTDDWAEQKYLEGLGRREVYDYGKPLPTERVVLSSIWGVLVTLLASRVVWQVRTTKCNDDTLQMMTMSQTCLFYLRLSM